MAPRFEPGFGYYNEYPGRRDAEDDGEDVSGEGEDSDEEAAALARIRDRSTSRRGTEKRSFVGGLGREALGATAAKRQKAVEPVVEADNWVCCDRCNKWRLLRKDVFDRTVREDEQWFCEYNYGRPGASCADMDDEKAQALGQQRPPSHTLQAPTPLNRPGAAATAAGLAHHLGPGVGQQRPAVPQLGGFSAPSGYEAQPQYGVAPQARPQLPGYLQNQAALAAALQNQVMAGRQGLMAGFTPQQQQQYAALGALPVAGLGRAPEAGFNPAARPAPTVVPQVVPSPQPAAAEKINGTAPAAPRPAAEPSPGVKEASPSPKPAAEAPIAPEASPAAGEAAALAETAAAAPVPPSQPAPATKADPTPEQA